MDEHCKHLIKNYSSSSHRDNYFDKNKYEKYIENK